LTKTNKTTQFSSSCPQSNALQQRNLGDVFCSAVTAPITALAERHTTLGDYSLAAASAEPPHTPELCGRTWCSALARGLALAGRFQRVILLFRHKHLLLTTWILERWQVYNWTKTELVPISTAQRAPKNGSLSLDHHIPVCTGQVKKPCWVKVQWPKLWTSGID